MKRMFKWPLLLFAAVLAVVIAGCGQQKDANGNPINASTSNASNAGSSQDSGLTVAMVTHSDEGTFWTTVKNGAEAGAKQEGVKLIWSPSNNDPQKQAQLIDAAVSQKVDGLAVSVPNVDAIKGSLEKAKAAGIPIITLNSGINDYKTLGAITHVGSAELIAGKAVGARLKTEGYKKVLCVIQEQNNIGLQQRCQGVKEGFGGPVTNMQVKGTSDLSTTQTEIKSKLQADKSFDAVVALETTVAETAKTAIKGSNSSAKLATFDLSADVIKDIAAGNILFAVDQQPYLQGYLPVVFLKLFKTNANSVGGGQPVLTGPSFVDKSNADAVGKLAAAGTR
jgi:simple sugar transport system substrate-binding protein